MKFRRSIPAVSLLALLRRRQEPVNRGMAPEPPTSNETSGTNWQWVEVAGIGATPAQNRQAKPIKWPDDAGFGQDRIGRILRPTPPADVVPLFVDWCQQHGFHGEWLWSDLWSLYEEYICSENEILPLPNTMRPQFAHHLSLYCRRFQVSVYEKGRRRRLTAYLIPEA